MSVEAYGQAEAIAQAWNNERILERNQHNPAQLTGLRDRLVARIIVTQAGAANTSNVLAALQSDVTIAAAVATIGAL